MGLDHRAPPLRDVRDPVLVNQFLQRNRLALAAGRLSKEGEADSVEDRRFARARGPPNQKNALSLEGGKFSIVEGGDGGNCKICNRIRLTANGLVKPCLFNNIGYSIRELGNEEALRLTIENKPKSGTVNTTSNFYNLGG